MAAVTQLAHRLLSQQRRRQRIDAAADTEDVAAHARGDEIILQESSSPFDLPLRVDIGGDTQFADDLALFVEQHRHKPFPPRLRNFGATMAKR